MQAGGVKEGGDRLAGRVEIGGTHMTVAQGWNRVSRTINHLVLAC